MSEETIWYRNGEQKVGPFSISTIKELREKNAISDDTLVSDDDGTNWTAYSNFSEKSKDAETRKPKEQDANVPEVKAPSVTLPEEPSLSKNETPKVLLNPYAEIKLKSTDELNNSYVKRRPFLAAFLSFLTPGLGNLYNNKVNNFFLVWGCCLISGWSLFIDNIYAPILAVIIFNFLWVFSILQSFIQAIKIKKIQTKDRKKFYIFLLPIIILSSSGYMVGEYGKFETYSIPSGSMKPTLLIGDYFIEKKYSFSKDEINRGDLVVFKHPVNDKTYIKRLIGLPGDEISIKNGRLTLNGKTVPTQRIDDFIEIKEEQGKLKSIPRCSNAPVPLGAECKKRQYLEEIEEGLKIRVLDISDNEYGDNLTSFKVPKDSFFFIGDNRDNSLDSRFGRAAGGMGFVTKNNISGKVSLIFWNKEDKSRIGTIPK